MRSKIVSAACIAMCMAISAQGVVGPNLPPVDISINPTNPSTSDYVLIILSGLWPDTCVPEQMPLAVFPNGTIWIDVLLPGWDDPNECASLSCTADPTAFEVEGLIGYMVTGHYEVYGRVISCDGIGQYRPITSFDVTEGKPDDAGCTACQAYRFAAGGRVVLLTDNPPGGPGLKAGHGGTVLCRDCTSGCGRILVSWDLWTGGQKDVSGCVMDVLPGFPPTSAMWVDLGQVRVGRPFNQTGTLRKGLEGCLVFVADSGMEYNIVATGEMYWILEEVAGMGAAGRIRIQGLLSETQPKSDEVRICPQRNGDIYHPIISACEGLPHPDPGACELELLPGDRVRLLVDHPMGAGGGPAVGLVAGTMGTVICTDSTDDDLPFYVSWDNWTEGTDTDYFCDSVVVPYVPDSGWWMRCHEVELVYRPEP
ncbi:hypothetical protein [Anaerobaca lacustris]|uniref:Uncharacterized protein n=1 Tax=Anaerobaca lacustris TaxID=3044600 RepID=A0AAW6U0U0_9BACT|nr:hypothetical protein [Sedimentisphaerales bacterium M17dextr]